MLEASKIASSNFLFFQFLYRNNKNNNYFFERRKR
jgi:hypothetical protein